MDNIRTALLQVISNFCFNCNRTVLAIAKHCMCFVSEKIQSINHIHTYTCTLKLPHLMVSSQIGYLSAVTVMVVAPVSDS